MDNYEALKEHTFLSLIENTDTSISLITSSLIISYYCERCIEEKNNNNNTYAELIDKKFKPLVSKSYLNSCANKILFSNKKINKLDYMQKIKLVRNKLAHGDFVIDPLCENIIIKIVIKGEEIETAIPITSIIELAKNLGEYSRYPKSNIKGESIYYKDGYEYKFIDYPKTNHGRNFSYEKGIQGLAQRLITTGCLRFGPYSPNFARIRKMEFGNGVIEILGRITDKEDGKNLYPNRKQFEWNMLYKLDNPLDYNQDRFLECLIEYYRYFIYPLENFLKIDDINILSLQDESMFNFEALDIVIDDDIKNIEEVGKIKDYNNQFSALSNKAINSFNDLDKLLKEEHYPNLERMENLESYTEDFINLMGSSAITKYYEYSKKRSLIEHLRCSIEHGSYDYDEKSVNFIDNWQDNSFNISMDVNKLENIVSSTNKELILEQFNKVYKRSKSKIRTK